MTQINDELRDRVRDVVADVFDRWAPRPAGDHFVDAVDTFVRAELQQASHDFCVELEKRRQVERMLSRLIEVASTVCDEAWVGTPHPASVIRCGEVVTEARKFAQ